MSDAWFRPKTFGYGAGLPIRWQGWALLAAYVLSVTAVVRLSLYYLAGPERVAAIVPGILVLTAALILIGRAKTEGGWRWRSGGGDD